MWGLEINAAFDRGRERPAPRTDEHHPAKNHRIKSLRSERHPCGRGAGQGVRDEEGESSARREEGFGLLLPILPVPSPAAPPQRPPGRAGSTAAPINPADPFFPFPRAGKSRVKAGSSGRGAGGRCGGGAGDPSPGPARSRGCSAGAHDELFPQPARERRWHFQSRARRGQEMRTPPREPALSHSSLQTTSGPQGETTAARDRAPTPWRGAETGARSPVVAAA